GAVFVGPVDDVTMLNDVGMAKGFIQAKRPLGQWAQYLRTHPTDLRRAYVASGVADTLLGQTLLGSPSRDRDYRVSGLKPQAWNKAPHASLVGTRRSNMANSRPPPTQGSGRRKEIEVEG